MGPERRATRWAAWVVAVLAVGGCVEIDDPEHCANREGDATCRKIYGEHAVCDACDHFHHGCVDEAPPPECRVDSGQDAGEGTDDASTGEDVALECDDCPSEEGGR